MDTGLTTRPTGSPAQTGFVRPEPAPVREAVAAQLPPSQAVTAAATAAAPRNDAAGSGQQSSHSHEFVLDAANREVIYRVIDVRSGRVVRQMPDQALMRLRAYTRAIQNGETPAEAHAQSDLRA